MNNKYDYLKFKCAEIRKSLLEMIAKVGSGHPGSSLSLVEILVILYYHTAHFGRKNYTDLKRDRIILSKGHAAPAMYAILIDLGIIEENEKWNLRQFGSTLQGHPDKAMTQGIEISTGSLGQGLSAGVGLALGGKKKKFSSNYYVILGDGECQEGQIWEAAALAGTLKLNNLTAIVDYNKIQHDGFINSIIKLEPFAEKWRAFLWEVDEVDGHNLEDVIKALSRPHNKPKLLIAHTIKGKGVDYMENNWEWHSVADPKKLAEDFI